jgi:predicted ATPase
MRYWRELTMLNRLKLRNFKCFGEATFGFNQLTILAGGNATGKSSVVQALLFHIYATMQSDEYMDIRNVYALDLGVAKSLISHEVVGADNNIEIETTVGIESIPILFKATDESPYMMKLENSGFRYDDPYIKYLKAERIGPRAITPVSGSTDDIGYAGEFTPSVIDNADKWGIKIHEKLSNGKPGKSFSAHVESIMGAILDKLEIDITTDNVKGFTDTRYKNAVTEYGVMPTQTGFGITYVMPIVVAGLLCSVHTNSILIVENPEAHLHPKAQSRLGRFLALLAECGVQVVLETHSEHIVDGARVQLKNNNETDKMTVVFFETKNKRIVSEEISLDKNGELSYWPKGFFDQKLFDLRELLSK